MDILWVIYDFFFLYLLVFIIYIVFINKRKKNYSKLKKNDEIVLFVNRYNIDVEKVGFKKIKTYLALINSFIIAFSSTIIIHVDGLLLKVGVGFVVIMVMIYSLYEIVGRKLKTMEGDKKCTTVKKSKKNGKNIG
jgi:uncharacterized membrane protein YjjP (DUF1212 family)